MLKMTTVFTETLLILSYASIFLFDNRLLQNMVQHLILIVLNADYTKAGTFDNATVTLTIHEDHVILQSNTTPHKF